MSLLNLRDKTALTISDTEFKDKITETYWSQKVGQPLLDLTNSLLSKTVQPNDFINTDLDRLDLAFADAKTSRGMLELPIGAHTLATELSTAEGDSISIRGVTTTNTRDANILQGPHLLVTIDDNTKCGLRIGHPAALLENFVMEGDLTKSLEAMLCMDRNRDDTTLGNYRIQNVHIHNSGGDGIKLRAPDNGSLVINSSANNSLGIGLNIIPSSSSPVKGLNQLIIGSRFLHNEAGNAVYDSSNQSVTIGCGFLGPDTDDSLAGAANLKLIGNSSSCLYNTFIANDMENNVGVISGDTTRACFEMDNTRGTVLMNNRIGSGFDGIRTIGTVRSLLLIQNYFTGLTNPINIVSGTAHMFFLGDQQGITHKDKVGAGTLRYLTFWIDRSGARTHFASNHPIHINEDGEEDVYFFDDEVTPSRFVKINGHMKFTELAGDPPTPAAGDRHLYAKAGGMFMQDSGGVVTAL